MIAAIARVYDPKERAAEKQRQRDEDQRRLRDGEVSRQNLREGNSFFSFADLSITNPGGSPRRRR
jgi:hypothetical protein